MFDDSAALAAATRGVLLKLPRVTETVQWGGMHVFWVLEKAVGGKIFTILNPGPTDDVVVSFAAGPVRAPQLLELDGVRPAPHLARAHWVALADWQVLTRAELTTELHAAHAYVSERLPPRVRRLQELSAKEYREVVRERRAAVQQA